MSYNEFLLPSLNSLKWKEVVILCDGEINGMINVFSFVLMVAHSPPLNMALVCIFIFKQFGIQLVLESIHFVIHSTPLGRFKECIIMSLHYIWSPSRQVNAAKSFFALFSVQREPPLQSTSLVRLPSFKIDHIWVNPMVFFITSTSYFVACFMSMMRESSWPFFDESIPVELNTSSSN